MTQRLVVVGVGGFGRETLDVVAAVNAAISDPPFQLLGVLDDNPSPDKLRRLVFHGVTYLGLVDNWLSCGSTAGYAIGVGDPAARRRLAERFDGHGDVPVKLIHPSAVIGSAGSLAPGSIVCAGVQISTNVHLGRHVHLNPSVTIGHDSVLEEFVSVNPAATISGECTVGAGALIGAASIILQGLVVGASAIVGAGACAVHDVPPGATVKGVPAR